MRTAQLVNRKSMWYFGAILPHKQGSGSEVIRKLFIAILYNQTRTKSTQTTINACTPAPQHAFGCSITKQMSLMSRCVYSNRKLLCKLPGCIWPQIKLLLYQAMQNPRCTYRRLKVFHMQANNFITLDLLYCFVFQHIRHYGIFLIFCPSSTSFPATTNPPGIASSSVTASSQK